MLASRLLLAGVVLLFAHGASAQDSAAPPPSEPPSASTPPPPAPDPAPGATEAPPSGAEPTGVPPSASQQAPAEPQSQLPDVEVKQQPAAEPEATADAPPEAEPPPQAQVRPKKVKKPTRAARKKPPAPAVAAPTPQQAPAAAAPTAEPLVEETSERPGAEFQVPRIVVAPGKDLSPVSTLTDADLRTNPAQSLGDVLSNTPGVVSSTFAPGASRPVIRGLDNNRVRIQEGGIGTHDASTLSEDHAVPIDPNAAERIDVIRGPGTLRYGGQALGGVVSVDNDRVPSLIPPMGIRGAVIGGLSSVNDGRDGGFRVTAGSGMAAVHMDAFRRVAEDYDTPQGKQPNSYVDSLGGAVGASFIGSDGYLGAALVRLESEYGIPGEDVFIDMAQTKLLSKGEWRMRAAGVEAVRFWFGASDYAHDEVEFSGEVGSRFTNREQEARLEFEFQPAATALGQLTGSAGVSWGHGRLEGRSFEGSSLLEPAETDRIATFVFQNLALTERLEVLGAARIDHNRIDGTGLIDFSDPSNLVAFAGTRRFTPASFSAGLSYELGGGVQGRITGSRIERAPEAAELYSKGLHEATGTFEIGNPNLEKEAAHTLDLGIVKADGPLRFDASLYATRFDGFITKELTGVTCGDTIDTCGAEDELDQILFSQRDARFYGAEVSTQYDVAPIWNGVWGVEAQYDFVHARFEDGGNVPRIPPHRLGGGLYYRDAAWFARAGILHAFDQNRIADNETATGGYTLVSAELRYTLPHSAQAPEVTIGLRGENLADDEVRNHVSFTKDDVLQPGASVRLFGSIKLN